MQRPRVWPSRAVRAIGIREMQCISQRAASYIQHTVRGKARDQLLDHNSSSLKPAAGRPPPPTPAASSSPFHSPHFCCNSNSNSLASSHSLFNIAHCSYCVISAASIWQVPLSKLSPPAPSTEGSKPNTRPGSRSAAGTLREPTDTITASRWALPTTTRLPLPSVARPRLPKWRMLSTYPRQRRPSR